MSQETGQIIRFIAGVIFVSSLLFGVLDLLFIFAGLLQR